MRTAPGKQRQPSPWPKNYGEAIGAAVLIVHHHGKNAEVGMRGSSAYFGSADFVLTVNKKKTEAVGRLILDKSRDAQDGITVGQFTLVPQVIGTKPDGSQFTQIYVNQTEFEPLPQFEPTDAGSAAFIKAVDRALADYGRNEDVPGVGSSIRVVEQRHVRHAFTETYGTAKDGERRSKEAINQEFNRAKIKAAQAVARSGEGNETKFWRVTL